MQQPPRPPIKTSPIAKGIAIACMVLFFPLVILSAYLAPSAPERPPATATPRPAAAAPATVAPTAPPKPTAATAAPPTSTTAPAPKPAAKPTDPPKAQTLARIGDRAESGGIAITVNSVRRTGDLGQFMKAKPGRTYAVVDVLLETTGRDKAPYNPLYFKVKDADGFEYSASPFGEANALKSGELAQGEKVRGIVSFDVPSEAKGLVLSYQPIVILGGYQTIRVQLE